MVNITAQEAARRLGVSEKTIWRWRDAGKLREAGRYGRTVVFDVQDVDALRGVDASANLTMADVYKRLANAETWEEIGALKRDVADTICLHADEEGREVITTAWRAACAMAATHPQQDARDRWTQTARTYGAWIGKTPDDTASLISLRSNVPYESAKAEAKAAPFDPAYTVAALASRK